MTEYIDKIFDILIVNFDIAYMLSINVLTYGLIKCIDTFNNKKKVKLTIKRMCLIISTIVCCVLYKYTTNIENNVLLNSTIAAPVFYSWVIKPILNKYKIGYNKEE